MSTITLRRTHHIGKSKARDAVESIARELQGKLQLEYRWDGDDLRFERPGAKGTIHVSETEVRFEADLGLLLRPLRAVIEHEVAAYFDFYFFSSRPVMATIDLRRPHSIGKEKAREAVESIARELQGKLGLAYRWEGDDVRFKRPGAEGTIHVTDREVRFEAHLGLLLRPLRGTVEKEVIAYLDRYLGSDQA